MSIAEELLIEPRWYTLGEAALPRHGIVRIRERWWKTHLQHEYSLQWQTTGGECHSYLIWRGGNRVAQTAEIRASRGYARVWLVTHDTGDLDPKSGRYDPALAHVIASLDTRTGAFIGENGVTMDPSLPLGNQEPAGMQLGQPRWADPNGGILLGIVRP